MQWSTRMQRKSWSSQPCIQLHFVPTCFLTKGSGICEHTWDTHKCRGDKHRLIQGRRFLSHCLYSDEAIKRNLWKSKTQPASAGNAGFEGMLVLRAFALFVVFHSWPLCFGLKNVLLLLMSLGKHKVRIRWLKYAHCEALLHSTFSLILHRNPWQPTVSPHPIIITLIITTPLQVLCMRYSEGYWTGEGGASGDVGMTKSCRIVRHSRSRCTTIFSCRMLEARDYLTT